MSAVVYLVLFIFIGAVEIMSSLQVIPERASIGFVNSKYVSDLTVNVRRYSRRSKYYVNVEGVIKHTWANNVSVHLIFYEYLHNEYKRSFVEMHFKLCDMVNKDPYVGKAVANSGLTCSVLAGPFYINNLTVPANDFPNVWPFERSKVEINITLATPPEELIATLEIFVLFKQKIGK